MPAQKGRDLLLKQGDGASPEVFTTIGGMRSTNISLNQETVEITNKSSTNRWRQLLADAGVRSASFSGSGVFTDSTIEQQVNTDFMAAAEVFKNYQIIVPSLGTFDGPMQITSLEYAGEHNGEATYNMTFESAGAITFAAV